MVHGTTECFHSPSRSWSPASTSPRAELRVTELQIEPFVSSSVRFGYQHSHALCFGLALEAHTVYLCMAKARKLSLCWPAVSAVLLGRASPHMRKLASETHPDGVVFSRPGWWPLHSLNFCLCAAQRLQQMRQKGKTGRLNRALEYYITSLSSKLSEAAIACL